MAVENVGSFWYLMSRRNEKKNKSGPEKKKIEGPQVF